MAGSTTLVVGIGNAARADDAAGLVAARRVREMLAACPDMAEPGRVAVVEHDGEGTNLVTLWEGHETVILIDAVSSGAPPGSILRFDACSQPIPPQIRACSTHAFGVAEAVELARALGRLPPRLIVYGIEGRSFSAGAAMSAEVEAALAVVAERVLVDAR